MSVSIRIRGWRVGLIACCRRIGRRSLDDPSWAVRRHVTWHDTTSKRWPTVIDRSLSLSTAAVLLANQGSSLLQCLTNVFIKQITHSWKEYHEKQALHGSVSASDVSLYLLICRWITSLFSCCFSLDMEMTYVKIQLSWDIFELLFS